MNSHVYPEVSHPLMGQLIFFVLFIKIIPWRVPFQFGNTSNPVTDEAKYFFQMPIKAELHLWQSLMPGIVMTILFAWCLTSYFTSSSSVIVNLTQRTPPLMLQNRDQLLQAYPQATFIPEYTEQVRGSSYKHPVVEIKGLKSSLNEIHILKVIVFISVWYFLNFWAIQKTTRHNKPLIFYMCFMGLLLLVSLSRLYLSVHNYMDWSADKFIGLKFIPFYMNHKLVFWGAICVLLFGLYRYGLHAFKNREVV